MVQHYCELSPLTDDQIKGNNRLELMSYGCKVDTKDPKKNEQQNIDGKLHGYAATTPRLNRFSASACPTLACIALANL